MIKIALLGFGTVGKGAYNILQKKKSNIEKAVGDEVFVKKILKRNLNFKTEIDKSMFTDRFEDILEDVEIKLIVEMTGDLEKSYIYIKEALNAKKHVVTANKAVVSKYFEEFLEIAAKNEVAFLYEASVAGSIPIITPLKSQLLINNITKVRGILNGTSNFLLTNMQDRKSDYSVILKEAQELGYAEADPFDDVEGVDALRKLRILSTMCFKSTVKNEDIILKGISSIDLNDILYLDENNYKIKLIAESKIYEDGFQSIVEPVILKTDDELYGIDGAENSVEIFGENYGSLVFTGEGAGSLPTGNAIVSDIIDALSGKYYPVFIEGKLENKNDELTAKYYIRINTDTKNNIDSSAIMENFKDIKISSFDEHDGFVIITTEEVSRKKLVESLKFEEKDYFFARFN